MNKYEVHFRYDKRSTVSYDVDAESFAEARSQAGVYALFEFPSATYIGIRLIEADVKPIAQIVENLPW